MSGRHQTVPTQFRMQPVMASLTILYAAMLEVGLAVGHYYSGGKWPSPVKYVVVAAVMILAFVYKMKLPNDHAAEFRKYSRIKLNGKQTALVLCFLMSWVALVVWLLLGPPGPEFNPA